MTKKDFKERASVHHYGKRQSGGVLAVFFDWKTTENSNGFKYCIFARMVNARQNELLDMLKDFIEGRIEDTPWYVQLIIAPTEEQRFKVPLDSGGLNRLVKYEFKPTEV
jgi:hypothetical protein